MQFFSEEYLAHYGVKGMKWRKHKLTRNQDGEIITDFHETPATPEPDFDTSIHLYPEVYLDTASGLVNGYYLSDTATQALYWDDPRLEGERKKIRQSWTPYRRDMEKTPEGKKRVEAIRAVADELRRRDLDYMSRQREKAYHKNEKRLEKQQKKAKVKNSIKRAKNSAVNKVKKAKDKVKGTIHNIRRRKKKS